MATPACVYKRVSGVWYLDSDCQGDHKDCPEIPNTATSPDTTKDNEFRNMFRTALSEPTFNFVAGSTLTLGCEGYQGTPSFRGKLWYRNGGAVHTFSFSVVAPRLDVSTLTKLRDEQPPNLGPTTPMP